MKVAININEKIQDKPFGSFGAACTIELDINQAGLAHPADVLSQISFAADLARAAVNRELDLQRKKMPTPTAPARDREPVDADEPWDGDDEQPVEHGYRVAPEPKQQAPATQPQYRSSDSGARSGGRSGGGRDRNWKTDGGRPMDPSQLYGFAKDWDDAQSFKNLGKAQDPQWPSMFKHWSINEMNFALDEWFKKRSPAGTAPVNGNGRR